MRVTTADALNRPPTHRWMWEGRDGNWHKFSGSANDRMSLLYESRKGKACTRAGGVVFWGI